MNKQFIFVFICTVPLLVSGQLIGSRGVIVLEEGEVYRDAETREASATAANFAKHYQAEADVTAEQNHLLATFASKNKSIRFATKFGSTPVGAPLRGDQIFGFSDSRRILPAPAQRRNKIHPEVEKERRSEQPQRRPLARPFLRPALLF